MELEGLEHLSARMGPAGAMHHVATAHTVVCEIPVGLQNAFELAQEFLRTLAAAPHPKVKPKVKHDTASRPAVLPQVSLMVFPALIVHLHGNRCFIGLNVTSND